MNTQSDNIETKAWWQSKTVIASIVAFLAIVLGAFGVTVDEAFQADIVEKVLDGVAAICAIIAIYGRVSASVKIR